MCSMLGAQQPYTLHKTCIIGLAIHTLSSKEIDGSSIVHQFKPQL